MGATAVPLRTLIRFAYDIQDDQLSGGPTWLNSDAFDVEAKVTEQPAGLARFAPDTLRLMLRRLLADRFKLLVHNETRELPVFALMLARRDGTLGPQLRKSDVDCEARARNDEPPLANEPGKPPVCGGRQQPGHLILSGFPLSFLTTNLSTWAGRIVFDRTGLQGPFNLDLHWSVEQRPQFDPIGASASRYNISPDPSLPSLFTAVEEQLGLKLESQRAAVNVLVVDRAEQPIPN